MDRLNSILDRIAEEVRPHFSVGDMADYVSAKTGALGTRYEDAVSSILERGFIPHYRNRYKTSKDMEISMFLKTEIYLEESKDPRMISGCNTKFNCGYAKFTTAFERAFKHKRQVMSGRNLHERGQAFQEMLLHHQYIKKTDHSRFDSNQRVKLQYDIWVGLFKRLLPHNEFKLFRKYWEQETEKHGRYPNGLTFSMIGCMASGSMATKAMNTLINCVAIEYFCDYNGFKLDYISDGDDGGIGMDHLNYTDTFSHFGLDVESADVNDYHDFDFCSSKFMRINSTQFMQVQSFPKCYNNLGIIKSRRLEHCASEFYYSLGYMYSILYPNFPGYSELSQFLMRMAPKHQQHFKPQVLDEVSPFLRELLPAKGAVAPNVDYQQLWSEFLVSYGLSHNELSYMLKFLSEVKITLPRHMCKRYRVVKAPRTRHTPQQYTAAEAKVDQAILTARPPPLLANLYDRKTNGWDVYSRDVTEYLDARGKTRIKLQLTETHNLTPTPLLLEELAVSKSVAEKTLNKHETQAKSLLQAAHRPT
jgi:hypothetical protein